MIDVLTPTHKGYTVKKVSEKMIMDDLREFDDAFPDGVYAVPRSPKEPRVKVRALLDYCKLHDTTPENLSEKEMEQFLVR
ncbi:hypothetical protein PP175_29670 (plasmid) [Aneurinibacillus sp. Ricciae_BoGa-3]|uniref:hypothetical protein n=1 Tax=Aneurinibacillus sp. Ricciae_BoGa-3 TaxID=3022697 RepID=UPI00234145CA|nr:hypothetical protein [Aneurinibacillus sp. Ricciae_BoGa-3]WCK57780.1 hypothetical protein PP175_29670 [Aneurinibacillus sp. Ricciae_BoGa-3]